MISPAVERPTETRQATLTQRKQVRGATDRCLSRCGGDQLKSVAAPPSHSVFCDSLEVYGADWTALYRRSPPGGYSSLNGALACSESFMNLQEIRRTYA